MNLAFEHFFVNFRADVLLHALCGWQAFAARVRRQLEQALSQARFVA